MQKELKLMILDSARDLGDQVSKHLRKMMKNSKNFSVSIVNSRFSNGEAKVILEEDIRDTDLYILADVGNYSLSYTMQGNTHYMSPDEHFQDIKRAILAASGHAERITVVMPLLYQARQHKRKGQESLDCACALQELERLHVNEIVTFDAHDPNVSNAIPLLPFENIYPTNTILKKIIEIERPKIKNLLVISPDMGAMERSRYYAEMLGCDVGVFYKRRDLSVLVNGKNPIIDHVYMGTDVKGKDILVVDDMIASGASMLEVGKELREKGARDIYLIASFALLTEGISAFLEGYKKGYFTKLYSTNLSYVPDTIKQEEWYEEVDCSYQLAETIYLLNTSSSLRNKEEDKKEITRCLNCIQE